MKIAMYEFFGSQTIYEVTQWRENDEDYIRLSKPVEVEFTKLPERVTVPLKVEAIQRTINAAREEFNERIAKLEFEKAKLLAIAHEEPRDE